MNFKDLDGLHFALVGAVVTLALLQFDIEVPDRVMAAMMTGALVGLLLMLGYMGVMIVRMELRDRKRGASD